jgi:hypothetical protein
MRNQERGSAMLVTLIIIAALFAGAVVLVAMQLTSNKSSEIARTGNTAVYCAEAGLAAARPVVAAGQTNWATALTASAGGDTTEPTWLSSGIGSHDIDGDGSGDFEVYLLDNDDETSVANNRAADIDSRIFIVSRCKKYADNPKQVMELIEYQTQTGTCYESQEGGCSQQGNAN